MSITRSEFRYRDPVLDESTLLIVISQSGETADTIAALREAKEHGAKVLSDLQCAWVDDRARGGRHNSHPCRAGDRVASTKAFTAQMIALYLLGLYLG